MKDNIPEAIFQVRQRYKFKITLLWIRLTNIFQVSSTMFINRKFISQ